MPNEKLQSTKQSKFNRIAKSRENRAVRNITTSETTVEDRDRQKRFAAFMDKRKKDPDHVKKLRAKRKEELGLNDTSKFPKR